jgi:hypothetical protein
MAFDPNKPFTKLDASPATQKKVGFDPSLPFTVATGESHETSSEKSVLQDVKEGAQDAWTSFDPSFGFRDEIWGAIGSVFNPDNVEGDLGDRYEKYRDADRKAKSDAMQRSPVASTTGKFVGDAVGAALPFGAVGKVGSVASAAAAGMMQGGLQAAGDSNKDLQGTVDDTIQNAVISGVTAGAVTGGGEFIKQAAKSPVGK